MTFIYELLCPKTGDVRYIGKAKDPQRRYKRHLADSALMKSYANRWIAGLLKDRQKPMLRIVLRIGEAENWQEVERQCIAMGFLLGHPLTNTSAGGEGVLIVDPLVEAKRIASVRASWSDPERRAIQSRRLREAQTRPEAIASNRERMKARWADPAYAEECSRLVKEAYSTPEARFAQSERSRVAHMNPEVEDRRSVSMKAAWGREGAKEAWIQKLKQGNAKPEEKARRSAQMKARHADPMQKAKIMKALSDHEMIKRRGEAIKAGWARRLARLAEKQQNT